MWRCRKLARRRKEVRSLVYSKNNDWDRLKIRTIPECSQLQCSGTGKYVSVCTESSQKSTEVTLPIFQHWAPGNVKKPYTIRGPTITGCWTLRFVCCIFLMLCVNSPSISVLNAAFETQRPVVWKQPRSTWIVVVGVYAADSNTCWYVWLTWSNLI